ncbi:hypothetical protein FSB08_39190 [Paraburkholderia sp. JPY432]|nr:hypothetical protein [Paraburkholderia youngii]
MLQLKCETVPFKNTVDVVSKLLAAGILVVAVMGVCKIAVEITGLRFGHALIREFEEIEHLTVGRRLVWIEPIKRRYEVVALHRRLQLFEVGAGVAAPVRAVRRKRQSEPFFVDSAANEQIRASIVPVSKVSAVRGRASP